MKGWERAIYTLSVQWPQPHNIIREWEGKGKKKTTKRVWTQLIGKYKSIGPALETRQSHTVEYWVSKIVPQDTERGIKVSATRRRLIIPVCH